MTEARACQHEARDQRIRDPVHGLITFRKSVELEQLAWALLDAPEFQRLRRIKQLGPADLVFPGATHSRFAHCVGVFHTARGLLEIIRREIGKAYDEPRAEVAVLAALLHDVGHGPLSHAFEAVQRIRGLRKKHETWSAEIVHNPDGKIFPLLEGRRTGLATDIAAMLESEDPKDIYHAVVSSSFDADRLDYLRRDRLMTGTQAGAIDFDWLMEHIRVRAVEIDAPDTDHDDGFAPIEVQTFCLDAKALPAAEQFLLARYTLHEQVYLHKVKCCVERLFAELLRRVAEHVSDAEQQKKTGLGDGHALVRFLRTNALTDYLALDDGVLWGSLEQMARAEDGRIADLAVRLRERRLFKTLDVASIGYDPDLQVRWSKRIDRKFSEALAEGTVLKDETSLTIYTQIGADEERTHKKLHILDGGQPVEIAKRSRLVSALVAPKTFTRYYFSTDSARNAAVGLKEGVR
jgi:HD superfamily phosphohydrolase